MKIWICGAKGMLGSHFTRLLTKRKSDFIANDHLEIDITNQTMVSDFVRNEKITHIINCAAYTQVDKAEEEQVLAYQINAIGAQNLGIAARRYNARVVHFSTDYVFNGKADSPYLETDLCSPIGAYGISKLAGEIKLLNELNRACIIRTSWLFGFPGKNFIETMLKLMAEKETLRVVADQVGRPTYCQDLAEATLKLIDEDGIFHFANSFETSWHGFAKEIHQQALAMGYPLKVQKIEPIKTVEYPTPAERPAYSTLSTAKIERLFGLTPRSWREALESYLYETKKSSLQPIG